ncbi:hypothetical protein [Microbispora sp. CA-102843]|uniref:hypothetical protein n=1 Tax=Microbispora sp. CA-102843 TaxID=3239952 RepID=UPI003D8F8EC1
MARVLVLGHIGAEARPSWAPWGASRSVWRQDASTSAWQALAPVWERIPQEVQELYARALVAAGRLEEARAVWPAALPRRDLTWAGMMAARSATAIGLADREAAEECYRLLLPAEGEMAGLSTASVTFGPVATALGDLAVFLGRPEAAAGHYGLAAEVARQVGSPHWGEGGA